MSRPARRQFGTFCIYFLTLVFRNPGMLIYIPISIIYMDSLKVFMNLFCDMKYIALGTIHFIWFGIREFEKKT